MIHNLFVAMPHDFRHREIVQTLYDKLHGNLKMLLSFSWGKIFLYSDNETSGNVKFQDNLQFAEKNAHLLKQWDEPVPLVIVDKGAEEVWLVRDVFGLSTVYYANVDDSIIFSTNMKDLIAVFPRLKKINTSAVSEYLLFNHIAGTRTIFSDIKQLEPGTSVSLRLPHINKSTFWKPSFKSTNVTFQVALNQMHDKIREIVQEQFKRVPSKSGLLLSGGIDSSLLCSYLAETTPNLATFSVGIPDYERSDQQYFTYVSKKCRTQQKTLLLNNQQFAQNLPKALWHMEEPLLLTNSIPLMLVCEMAKASGYNFLITGEGCDGLFSGGMKVKATLQDDDSIASKYREIILSYSVTGHDVVRDVLAGDFEDNISERCRILSEEFARNGNYGIEDVLNAFHIRTYTERLARRMFRMSVASAVTCVSPFLTQNFTNFLFKIPYHIRNRNGVSKYLLVDLASRTFGEEFAQRPKVGFNIPIGRWFRTEVGLGGFKNLLLEERTMERQFYKRESLKKALSLRLEDERAPLDYLLWSVLNLELWIRMFIENETIHDF